MIVAKLGAVILGLVFLLFGYFIYFRKKYDLINDFEAEFRAGRKDERYAERVGLTEFIIGVVLLAGGFILILFF